MSKNIIAIAIAALGFIIGLALLGNAIKNRNKSENTISVTGLGSKTFTSDLITWSGNFSRNSFELKSAYDQLAEDRKVIEKYMLSQGIPKKDIVFSAVDIQKQYNYNNNSDGGSYQTFAGYQLAQSISLQSTNVAKNVIIVCQKTKNRLKRKCTLYRKNQQSEVKKITKTHILDILDIQKTILFQVSYLD